MSELTDWLRNPYIEVRVIPSDRLKEVEKENERLTEEVQRLQFLYGSECNFNMRLQSILDEYGIKWR